MAPTSPSGIGGNAQTLSPDAQSQLPVAHEEPAHDEPAHDEPAHDEPAHDEPAHEEPAHDEPAHDEPAHDEPAHDEPAHDEPAHDEPFHAPPAQLVSVASARARVTVEYGLPKMSFSPVRGTPPRTRRAEPRAASRLPVPVDRRKVWVVSGAEA
jgi:hypothetical protein